MWEKSSGIMGRPGYPEPGLWQLRLRTALAIP